MPMNQSHLISKTRFVNISFHDLSPHSWASCKSFLEELKALGITQTNLLVVPNWYGNFPLQNHPDFLNDSPRPQAPK